jgi:hypothetical protein
MSDSRRFNVITSKGRVLTTPESRRPVGLDAFLEKALGNWPSAQRRPPAADPRDTLPDLVPRD